MSTSPSRVAIALRALAAVLPLTTACIGDASPHPSTVGEERIPIIRETFITALDTLANLDSPAVWHGPNGEHWVMITAKQADVLLVHDAATGEELRRVGGSGTAEGHLERPNGIAVLGSDLLLVVERDNRRVQGFRLPEFTPLGTFGESRLRLPYGIGWYEEAPGTYMVYVTDNYEMPDESVPPDSLLGERVKQFRVTLEGGRLRGEHVRSFGDTSGDGVLRKVESIVADAPNDRLLIAEEDERDSHWKVYDLGGRFERAFGRGIFTQEAEGIALYHCGESAGYWVATDQGPEVNTFHVFDRRTFEHLGAFRGAQVNTTDGVALTSRAFGPFPAGALFASHYDAAVAAISWATVADSLGLRTDCPR